MQRSEAINELAEALAKAQLNFEAIVKDKQAGKPGGKSYTYHYADLASQIKATVPALSANGLTVTQHPQTDGGKVSIETFLFHKSGQWISSKLVLPVAVNGGIQGVGSSITYGCRYARSAILGIAGEDDDGAKAQQNKPQPEPETKPQPKPQPQKPLNLEDEFNPRDERHKEMLRKLLNKHQIDDDQVRRNFFEIMTLEKIPLKHMEERMWYDG